MNIPTTAIERSPMQERLHAKLKNRAVGATAFVSTTRECLQHGDLRRLIAQKLRDALGDDLPKYDHRLSGAHLAEFLAFTDQKSAELSTIATESMEAALQDMQPEIVDFVKLLQRLQ